jgi:hypothetical protein
MLRLLAASGLLIAFGLAAQAACPPGYNADDNGVCHRVGGNPCGDGYEYVQTSGRCEVIGLGAPSRPAPPPQLGGRNCDGTQMGSRMSDSRGSCVAR